MDQKEFNELVRRYSAMLLKTNLPSYAKKFENIFKSYLAFSKKFSLQNFADFTNRQLAQKIQELDNRMVNFYEYQFYPFLVLEGISKEVEEILSAQPGGSERVQAISTLYKPTRISAIQESMLRLASKKRLTDKEIKKFADKNGWLAVYDYADDEWTWREFKQHLRELRGQKQIVQESQKNRTHHLAEYRRYLKSITDPVWKKKVEITHYFSYLKEMRDDYRREAYAVIRPLWEEIAKRLKCTVFDINFLTAEELTETLSGKRKFSVKEIAKRKKCVALASVNGKVQVLTGNKAKTVARYALDASGQAIKGRPACSGKVAGVCRIIYHRGEFGKFKTGDILITTMTHPEFLPIMKKAKAIVTDEGGVMCHAAIVARELGIPCIIGTKTATRLLRDGDMVEVDANKGIVRKI